jgi:hypothetical protein
VIYQDQKVILTSDGTKAGFDGGKITAYSWRVIEAPPGSPFEKSVKAETILSSGISYDTGPVTVAGDYKFTLGVSDGCSTAMAIVCFTVQCNCGPTANGGATSTIWTNTVKEQNDGQSSKGDNVASLTQTYFTLDGSYSYDFNTDDVLTYTWTFSAWEAISPSYKFLPTTNTTATAAVPGYVMMRIDDAGYMQPLFGSSWFCLLIQCICTTFQHSWLSTLRLSFMGPARIVLFVNHQM